MQQQLDQHDHQQVERLIADAERRAAEEWGVLVRGYPAQWTHGLQASGDLDDSQVSVGAARASLHSSHHRSVPDDQGRNIDSQRITTPHLQRELHLLVEARAVDQLFLELEETDDRGARRLAELLGKETDHGWVWKTDPRLGSRMAESDWALSFRNRHGGDVVDPGSTPCKLCGEILDGAASHAFCFAQGESTRGHYSVVVAVTDGMKLADPALRTEVRGLTESSARPADIYTDGAIPGKQAAVDITIASPDAQDAGRDVCATAYRKKI